MQKDIDLIIERLIADIPGVQIQQLNVAHPGADDDGLWFISIPDWKEEVQLESSCGNCPFLIESDFSDERLYVQRVEDAITTIRYLYGLG